jgi:hypothetical protein
VNSRTLPITNFDYHSIFIDDYKVYSDSIFADDLWIRSDIAFLTIPCVYDSIWCVSREFIDTVDYIRRMSLNIHWRLQGLQWHCFHWWFMDQQWHSVFDNSMRQPWLYFCYRFDALVVNSLTLSISYGRCHSVFIDDFEVYNVSVFTDDLWIRHKIAFLTIPFASHESIFSIDLMRRSWIVDAVDYIRRLSLNIQWQLQGLQWLCFCWRFMDK